MNLITRFFRLQIGHRDDLSGRPRGVLFIWRPQDGSKYGPVSSRWSFSFLFKPKASEMRFDPHLTDSECVALSDTRQPHDCKLWPDSFRKVSDAAVAAHLNKLGDGAKLVRDQSYCGRRIDLSNAPWQLYRRISVAA